jgi:hypothetical protein
MTCRFQHRNTFRKPDMILPHPDFVAGKINIGFLARSGLLPETK